VDFWPLIIEKHLIESFNFPQVLIHFFFYVYISQPLYRTGLRIAELSLQHLGAIIHSLANRSGGGVLAAAKPPDRISSFPPTATARCKQQLQSNNLECYLGLP